MPDPTWEPEPEPAGALTPPPRVPPTAVGLMTPPPPPHHHRARRTGELRRTRVVALGLLGGIFVAAGPVAAAAVESVVGVAIGSGCVLIGGSVWYRLAGALRTARVLSKISMVSGSGARRRAA